MRVLNAAIGLNISKDAGQKAHNKSPHLNSIDEKITLDLSGWAAIY